MTTSLQFLWRAWRYRLLLDPGEIRFLFRTLRPGDGAVDIGAHKGGYLYWMHRCVGESGSVFAFEPQRALAEYLRAQVARLGMRSVVVENLALSDVSGTARLAIPSDAPSCGATLEPGLPDEKQAVAVEVRTLDSYFAARPGVRIALIKCDAEGHELRIFQGGERLLREQRPALIFECEARHNRRQSVQDVFDYLGSLGYRGHFFRGRALAPIAEFTPAMQRDPKTRDYVNNFAFVPAP